MNQFCLGIIVAIGLTLPAFGQGVDPILGTWKMNADKSTFVGTTALKSDTYTFSGEGETLIDTVEIVDANGQTFKIVLRHIYDGMPHPTTGTPLYDSSTYTRIGNTINVVRSRAGKLVAVGQFRNCARQDADAYRGSNRRRRSAVSLRFGIRQTVAVMT
jgi:hypothetical protein